MDTNEADIASRIKTAITEKGGYAAISEKTGISQSTLVRMATGKTDPKLKDVIKISDATLTPLNHIAYGVVNPRELETREREIEVQTLIDGYWRETEKRLEAIEARLKATPFETQSEDDACAEDLMSLDKQLHKLKDIEDLNKAPWKEHK